MAPVGLTERTVSCPAALTRERESGAPLAAVQEHSAGAICKRRDAVARYDERGASAPGAGTAAGQLHCAVGRLPPALPEQRLASAATLELPTAFSTSLQLSRTSLRDDPTSGARRP